MNTTELVWNESDYNKWRNYPPGEYWGKDLTWYPNPRNTCSFDVDGYPVLVVLNTLPIERDTKKFDTYYRHSGWIVTVWRPDPGIPITSADEIVTSLDDIDAAVERLKEIVNNACLHPNSERLRPNYPMTHRFKCLDCGKVWGYDSSG